MKLLTAPESLSLIDFTLKSVFLAGSIEMDVAERWQDKVIKMLKGKPIQILNPRRADWDSSWKQEASDLQFRKQVEWELDAMTLAEDIIVFFDPSTKSPITLLELGLHADSGKLKVCCPDGFYRKGNVEIVCERHEVPMYENLESLVRAI